MKIIITGASGFVGNNLSHFLAQEGNEVVKTSVRGDLWKIEKDAEALIHLAGKAHDTANTSADEDYFIINRDLTIRIFNEFLKSEIKDFIYFSSVKASADTIDGFLSEDHSSDPKTPYGKSKREAELFLLSQTLPAGKRLFIIRPCMIHGPGNKGNLNLLYKVVEKGIPWPLAGFENRRSFLSISNLNFLIERILADKGVPSGIYNFADDEPLGTNELVRIIAKTSQKRERLLKISPRIITFVASMGDYLNLPLNSERLKKLTESYVVSNDKIKLALGIKQLPVAAEDGMQQTIQSFSKKEC